MKVKTLLSAVVYCALVVCGVSVVGCMYAPSIEPSSTAQEATPQPTPEVSSESSVTALFSLPALVGASEEDLSAALGKRTQRTESFANYKPAGCEEVMVRITAGRATSFTVYLSVGEGSPEDALRKVGINPTVPPDRTAPIAAIWNGSSVGVDAPEVYALQGAGSAGGWDGVQVK